MALAQLKTEGVVAFKLRGSKGAVLKQTAELLGEGGVETAGIDFIEDHGVPTITRVRADATEARALLKAIEQDYGAENIQWAEGVERPGAG